MTADEPPEPGEEPLTFAELRKGFSYGRHADMQCSIVDLESG